MVEPRTLMVSSSVVSRPLTVILTRCSAVFICGDTDEMVPLMTVPMWIEEWLDYGCARVTGVVEGESAEACRSVLWVVGARRCLPCDAECISTYRS